MSSSRLNSVLVFGVTLFLLVGCNRSSTPVVQVTIEPNVSPQPPRVGPATIEFKLKDSVGNPITGAHAALEGNMTHAGMTPVFADAREIAPGVYRGPIEFSMAGDWVIMVRITLSNGQKLERTFAVTGVRSD